MRPIAEHNAYFERSYCFVLNSGGGSFGDFLYANRNQIGYLRLIVYAPRGVNILAFKVKTGTEKDCDEFG